VSFFSAFNVFNGNLSFAHGYTPQTFIYTPKFKIPGNNLHEEWGGGAFQMDDDGQGGVQKVSFLSDVFDG